VSKPAIFLDRDGVISESRRAPGGSTPPVSADDVAIPEGVAEALERVRAAGFLLVVVTNQPDVARGSITRAAVDAINGQLRRALPLDAFYVCPHDGSECVCRKPRSGLLLDATHDLGLDLARSWLIGDRWVDIAAGAGAGVHTILLERAWSWNATSSGVPPGELTPDHIVPTVGAAADVVLGVQRRPNGEHQH
jgi:D-glycero-D-manno-heptose 1,7-bisphosphate phosphatase